MTVQHAKEEIYEGQCNFTLQDLIEKQLCKVLWCLWCAVVCNVYGSEYFLKTAFFFMEEMKRCTIICTVFDRHSSSRPSLATSSFAYCLSETDRKACSPY